LTVLGPSEGFQGWNSFCRVIRSFYCCCCCCCCTFSIDGSVASGDALEPGRNNKKQEKEKGKTNM
jgi:streptolysin S family bacteriocin protoxin